MPYFVMKRTNPPKKRLKKLEDKKNAAKPLKDLPIFERYSESTTSIRTDSGAEATDSFYNNSVRVYELGKRPRTASEKERERYFAALKKERD